MKLCLRQNKNEDHCLGSGLFLSKISWKYPSDFDIFFCMLSLYWECLEKDKGARILKDKKQKISFDKRYLLLLVAGFLTGRVWLYGINPFGVALFAAVAAERKGRTFAY